MTGRFWRRKPLQHDAGCCWYWVGVGLQSAGIANGSIQSDSALLFCYVLCCFWFLWILFVVENLFPSILDKETWHMILGKGCGHLAISGSASCCTSSPGEGVPSEVQPIPAHYPNLGLMGCFTEWTTGRTLLSVCFLVLLLAHLCYSAAIGFRFMEQLITAHFTAGPQIDVAGCPAWTCPARLPRLRRLRLVWHLKDSPGNDSHIPSYTHIIFAHVWCVWWTCCSCLCRIHFSGNYFVLFELIVVWFTSRLICLFPTDFEWNHARKLHITYSTN